MAELPYGLTLFVTGNTPRSLRAVANIHRFCDTELEGACDIEVVDLFEHPERAEPSNVVVSPTLVRYRPEPVRLLFGDMSDFGQLVKVVKV